MRNDWRIAETEANWECDWESSRRFQLRYFKSLPFVEKCKAVENMCKAALYFQGRRKDRRRKAKPATPE
jgi:hypothetical protein